MNAAAMSLARARFHAAMAPGEAAAPASLSELLVQLSADAQAHNFDAELVGNGIANEFPFLRVMLASGTPPSPTDSALWESAIRWVLKSLRNWGAKEKASFASLRALLVAVMALDANQAGLVGVSVQLMSNQLTQGLRRLIESAEPMSGHGIRWQSEVRQQIESLAREGNFERLAYLVPHVVIFPAPDFWTAVVLMYNANPQELATLIEQRNDALFSITICAVLESEAIVLASMVNDLVFKFISVANLEQKQRQDQTRNSQHSLETLLLQVAQSSESSWATWMRALFKFPGRNSAFDDALAAVFQKLSVEHLISFFKAISLGYSHRAAAPLANMLIPFANSADSEEAVLRWTAAHEVWADWNYGKEEGDTAMFAPVACALDFPVSMYFASLPHDQRLADERNLLAAIETLEEKWFDSVTELVSERNRLLSRLRLVQHGSALANGSSQALPSPIKPDADPYARVRYHYHDVNSH